MEDEFDEETISRKFYPTDMLVVGLDVAYGTAHSVAQGLATLRDLVAFHVNWKFDQDAFHEQAALEIETMTNGDENG